ncbi:MAG: META domain-containing protein [Actinomycetales bacterium]|nr:META domain-containing protein [Tetrasphaera sp.]NLX00148.1 META domain-containing protein [Actinomycetales bacterium]
MKSNTVGTWTGWRIGAVVAAVVLTLALGACGWGDASSGSEEGIDPVGAWGLAEPGQPSLELHPDGNFTGTDGCNRIGGSWRLDGDQVVFSDVFTTLMACEGVDTWLSRLATATVTEEFLVVRDQGASRIGTLQRGS